MKQSLNLDLEAFTRHKRQIKVFFFKKQVASSSRDQNAACKGRWSEWIFKLGRGSAGVILWTWIKPWRTREQRPQASWSWRRWKEAYWPGPAAADSLIATTPATSSTDGQDWWLWISMHICRESKAFKDGRLHVKWKMHDVKTSNILPLSGAPCLWGRIQCKKGWDKNLQTETVRESNARYY